MAKNKTFGPITVGSIHESPFTNDAGERIYNIELRQTITTEYTSVGNNRQDGLFTADELGLEPRVEDSTRVAFMRVGSADPSWIDKTKKALASLPNARIYQILSHNVEDVLTAGQQWAIEDGRMTIADFEKKSAVPNTSPVIYRQAFFSKETTADIDFREAVDTVEESSKVEEVANPVNGG